MNGIMYGFCMNYDEMVEMAFKHFGREESEEDTLHKFVWDIEDADEDNVITCIDEDEDNPIYVIGRDVRMMDGGEVEFIDEEIFSKRDDEGVKEIKEKFFPNLDKKPKFMLYSVSMGEFF